MTIGVGSRRRSCAPSDGTVDRERRSVALSLALPAGKSFRGAYKPIIVSSITVAGGALLSLAHGSTRHAQRFDSHLIADPGTLTGQGQQREKNLSKESRMSLRTKVRGFEEVV